MRVLYDLSRQGKLLLRYRPHYCTRHMCAIKIKPKPSDLPIQDKTVPTTSMNNDRKLQEVPIKHISQKVKLLPGKEDIMTIPNFLTMSRIFLSPVLGYLVIQESYTWACGLFLCVGVTDLLDGWIARNFEGQDSAFGSFLDPLADKILISVAFVSLSVASLIPAPLTAVILSRDVGLIMAAFYVRYISLEPPRTLTRFFDATKKTAQLKPLLLSKVNTALQLGLVACSLAAPVFSFVDHPAMQCLWWLTGATTVITGIQYMVAKDTFKIISEAKSKSR